MALGASDSAGVGADNPTTEGWVYVVYHHMPVTTKLVNLGMPGARLKDALAAQVPEAAQLSPTWVTAWFGVNDLRDRVAPADFERDLNNLLEQLTTRTHAKVFLGDVPDITGIPRFQEVSDVERADLGRLVAAYNQAIDRQAAAHGVTLVRVSAHNLLLGDRPDLVAADGLHPSTQGHARLAAIFWEAMQPSVPAHSG